MRPHAFLFFALLPAVAQTQTTPDPYKNEALIFDRSETTIRMHADGTGERITHVLLRLQSESAARQFSVLSFAYAAANETPTITLVRVHKPDGTTVDTPSAGAMDMPAAVTREAPLYSDLKEKQLPVRSLSAGDTLEYELHVAINQPETPGHFWGTQHFTPPGTVTVLAEVLTLEVPKDKYVQVWSPNHPPTLTEHDGLRTYRWQTAQLIPAPKTNPQPDAPADTAPKDPDEDADGRKLPSVAWTTFHTWAEVGDWYRALALPRAQPNDAVRAKAAELTKDARTPEDQLRALYTFVSTRTRYIGIDFGIGRYQPHSAAEVLANNYGDCKDKDTLLEALLRAQGFHTAPALIGAGVTPVEAVPTPGVFNHVITTVDLPTGRIWLDSTPEVAPYRLLSVIIRDQLALVVPSEAPAALVRTPAEPPYPMTTHFEATGALDADGKFTSHITATYHDDTELLVRALARGVAPAEWDKVSQYLSGLTGFSGTTSHTTITNPDALATPIMLTYDYTHAAYGDWENRRIVPCFPALEFAALASAKTAPPADIQLGTPRTSTATCRIRLPEGYRTDPPDPIHVKTTFATLDKTYRFDGKDLIIERTIVVLTKKLAKEDWKQYQTFARNIDLSGERWIQLIQPTKPITIVADKPEPGKTLSGKANPGTAQPSTTQTNTTKPLVTLDGAPVADHPAEPSALPETASVNELLQSAWQQVRVSDWSGAAATLDQAKAKDAKATGLWAGYGTIAMIHRDYKEAATDFKKELVGQPENTRLISALSDAQSKAGDSTAARRTLQSFLDTHPGDLQISRELANLQNKDEDREGALKTLEAASRANPDDRWLRVAEGETLLQLGRKEEAAAAAKSALEGSDDTSLLNNAGYLLSETGLDLPYAEEVSRKSIAALEARSAAITPEEANSSAFGQANTLIAAWDTLGYILFREGKLEEAKPLIVAGWRNALRPEGGDHLGQLYEAMGQKEQALTAYRLADASIEGNNAPQEVREHIKQSLTRLGGGTAAPQNNGTQALQETRTYHVTRPEGVKGWGTFRLQLSSQGVIATQQMKGDDKLAAIAGKINALKFPELVPPGSEAHLLRSAVVSCSMGNSCDVVLVPNSGLQTEQ